MNERAKIIITNLITAVIVCAVTSAIFLFALPNHNSNSCNDCTCNENQSNDYPNEFISLERIPPLDLRGYDLDHFEVTQWFLDRINYHRVNFGVDPYVFYEPAVLTSLEHTLDMRNNNFVANRASDGRTHQQRHDRWFGVDRTKVTSASVRSRQVNGPMTREQANVIVDGIVSDDTAEAFILNPTYRYLGIGFSVNTQGRGKLSITMSTGNDMRRAHHARSAAEREEHRLAYLEEVRARRGWTPPAEE